MAILAIVAARNMCGMLAGCGNAVVAGSAGSEYLAVINHEDGRKNAGCVAVLTYVRCLHMRRRFACCAGAVVACSTAACDIGVIKIRGKPAICRMAIVTVIVAGDVRRMFATRSNAIVTGATGAEDL